jgi:hypothetical protein
MTDVLENSLTKKLSISCGILVLIYFSYVAACRGLSDIYRYVINGHIAKWQKAGKKPDLKLWNEVADIVDSAVSLSPKNSDLLLTAGWFYEWKPTVSSEEQREVFNTSMDYYRSSISLRPVWPLGWSELAHVKYKSGQFDAEFQAAFKNAIELGPWEPEILFGMSDLGYASYQHLTKENRTILIENTRRAVQRDPKLLYDLAKMRNYTALFCYVASANKRAMKYCEKSKPNTKGPRKDG